MKKNILRMIAIFSAICMLSSLYTVLGMADQKEQTENTAQYEESSAEEWTTKATEPEEQTTAGTAEISTKEAEPAREEPAREDFTYEEETFIVDTYFSVRKFKDSAYYGNGEDTYALIAVDPAIKGKVTLPETCNGHQITYIEGTISRDRHSLSVNAFHGCANITELVIPATYTSFGDGAFESCVGLKKITFLGNVSLGPSYFDGCESLSEIAAPNSNKYAVLDGILYSADMSQLIYYPQGKPDATYTTPDPVTSVNSDAFRNNTRVKNIVFSENVTALDDYVFDECKGVESITVLGDVDYLGCFSWGDTWLENLSEIKIGEKNQSYSSADGVLYNKDGTELLCYPQGKKDASFSIPEGVEYISSSGAIRSSFLKKISLPLSLKSNWGGMLENTVALEEIAVASDHPKLAVEDDVLYNKEKTKLLRFPAGKQLESFTIPAGVTEIDNASFNNCSALREIVVPSGISKIELRAFAKSTGLERIVLSETVTNIGSRQDYMGLVSIPSLKEVDVSKENPIFTSVKGVLYGKDKTTLILYPQGRTEERFEIPSDVQKIEKCAFNGCVWLKMVVIPEGITQIPQQTFANCDRLEEIIIHEGLSTVGYFLFANCPALKTVYLPKSVTKIYWSAFENCRELSDLYYAGTVAEWMEVQFQSEMGETDPFENVTIHYDVSAPDYSQTENIKEIDSQLYLKKDLTAAMVAEGFGWNAAFRKPDGTALGADEKLGSGMKTVKPDGTELTVVIKGDNDGDGEIEVADARLALRQAVGLEHFTDWQTAASLVSGGTEVEVSDARYILRAAVGLEDPASWFEAVK